MDGYDAPAASTMTIEETDSDSAALAAVVEAAGAVRTETLRVFNEDEYREIIAALP